MIITRAGHKLLRFLRSMSKLSSTPDSKLASVSPVKFPVPWGGYIAGKAWGNPDGHPVLAVHGWLDNAGSFDKLIPLLSDAIDLPGHGYSSHKPVGCRYHFIDYIADINSVITELKWSKFSLLCHSMGASLGTWFAVAQSDMMHNVVFIEGFGIYTRPIDDLPQLMKKSLNTPILQADTKIYPTLDLIFERMKEGYSNDPHMTKDAIETLAIRGATKVEGGYKFSRDLKVKQPSILYTPDAVNDAFLKQISFPTLLIYVEDSPYVHYEEWYRRISLTQHKDMIKVVKVAGGHHVHLCNPQVIAPFVSEFLLTSVITSNNQSML